MSANSPPRPISKRQKTQLSKLLQTSTESTSNVLASDPTSLFKPTSVDFAPGGPTNLLAGDGLLSASSSCSGGAIAPSVALSAGILTLDTSFRSQLPSVSALKDSELSAQLKTPFEPLDMISSVQTSAVGETAQPLHELGCSFPSLDLLKQNSPLASLAQNTVSSISNGVEMEWESFLQVESGSSSDLTDGSPYHLLSAESEDPLGEQESQCSSNMPLYSGSPLSVHDCLVTLLTYAQTVHLSGQDFLKLLQLVGLLLPQPNNLPKSTHHFFRYFEKDESELQVFYYCTNCWKQRASAKDFCSECRSPKKKVSYFLICPLIPQIQKLCEMPGFSEKLNYKNNREKLHPNNFEDLYDGSIYKNAEQTGLLSGKNVSLTWYTDGIAVFESSPYSLWPFVFIVNELPLEERYQPQNVLLGGLWGCTEKPHPNVFLLPIYQDVTKLSEGFPVKFDGANEEVTVKAHILFGRCDVPAKACFLNIKGHSGYFSCPRCLIRGDKSGRTDNVMVFPHSDVLQLRTEEQYLESVRLSLNSKDGHLGVMGPSILYFMTSSDFLSSVPIDSMHCIYLGVTKQLLNLWFNTAYSSEPFSLSQMIAVVNERLLALKLPHFVQRCLIGVDKLAFWKASMLRNFILYICLLVLKDLMKVEHYQNLSLFVDAISLLNQTSISHGDLQEADQLLKQFCCGFQQLYGVRHMSSNMHLLRHLSQSVSECGNLHVTNCFQFEDFNGKLLNLTHGTTHVSLQIFSRYSLLSELQGMIMNLDSIPLKTFCEKLTHGTNLSLSEKISSGTYVVGNFGYDTQHGNCVKELLNSMPGNPVHFQTFSRLLKKRILYVSSSYTRGSRVSSYCKYQCGNDVFHGKILTFVKTYPDLSYLVLISRSIYVPTDVKRCFEDVNAEVSTDLVPISNLLCVCFCLNVKDKIFVIDPLNLHEME